MDHRVDMRHWLSFCPSDLNNLSNDNIFTKLQACNATVPVY